MSKIINLKRGLDINLIGEAAKNISRLPLASQYGINPDDFRGFTPKLLVRVEDVVKAGSPIFFDKNHPEILVTSPVSGKVTAVNRGDKRKILNVVIEPDQDQEYREFETGSLSDMTREDVTKLLLESGMWTFVTQRPYGIIANPADSPKAIFISGFDSAPLAPDMNYALADRLDDLKKGFEVLKKLTTGKVHLGLRAGAEGVLDKVDNAVTTIFKGPHPAGNVGVQIHHIDPINKGDIVWTVDVQSVAVIGGLFNSGKADMTRTIAVTGSEVEKPAYVTALPGAPVASVLPSGNIKVQKPGDSVRIICGNPLTGTTVPADGFIGYKCNQITVLPEGDKYAFLGWAMPRFDKFSVSRAYFSWICPKKKYKLDTNINGGHRAFVLTGLFEKYVPMDIYPLHLVKAILAGDIDKMENLGIYEIIEEDLALCEFVDPSKNDIQEIVRVGIDLMIKELS